MKKKKLWVRIIKAVHRIFAKKPEIIYLGEKIPTASLILCNHAGALGPEAWELFMDNFRFWATHEITEGTVSVYRYLSQVYFSQKQHWNKTAAKIVSFLVSPLLAVYLGGWELIPSYSDMRLSKTIKKTLDVLKKDCSVLIFPENSSAGYHEELTSVHPGFCLAGEAALKNGIDADMVFACLSKGNHYRLIIDKAMKFSKLMEQCGSRDAVADYACKRINELRQKTL